MLPLLPEIEGSKKLSVIGVVTALAGVALAVTSLYFLRLQIKHINKQMDKLEREENSLMEQHIKEEHGGQ